MKEYKTPINISVPTGTAPMTVASTTVVTNLNADKLDGQDGSYYLYTHPSGDGNLHVPATGTENNTKVLTAGSSAGSLSWSNVIDAILTGLSTASSAVVDATDNILSAMGKLQAQISLLFARKTAFTLCVVPNSSLCSLTTVAPNNMTIQQVNIVCRTIYNAAQSPTASTSVVLYKNGVAFLTLTNASGISDTEITSSPLPVSIAIGDKLDIRISAANGLNGLVSVTFKGVIV